MSKYQIGSVSFKQTVSTEEKFIISVAVVDWNYIKKNFSNWQSLSKYGKWGDLIG